MDLGLTGKTVVITGGSGGIGRGLVLEFAREGANVISVDLDSGDHLIEAAARGASRRIFRSRPTSRHGTASTPWSPQVHERFGPIDILVNNAGGSASIGPVEDLDEETRLWNAAINIDGMINCTLAAGADMLARGKGSIVNISSNASLWPRPPR